MTLLTPFDLAGLSLSSRVVMAPMTRSRAKDTVPDASTAEYYRQRASAGLLITEGSQISQEGQGYLFTPGIFSPAQVEGWSKVTEAVHEEGGRIFIQLWHVGRISHTSLQPSGQAPVSSVDTLAENTTCYGYGPDGEPGQVQVTKPRALTTEEIARVSNDFVTAAQNAIKAGFDGVEIHGANGYIFEQFINGGLNTRTDQYGGGIENRLRFLLETVDLLSQAIGSNRIGLRIAPFGRLSAMPAFPDERETWLAAAKALSSRNLAYLHLSDQDSLCGNLLNRSFVRELRDAYQGTVMFAGSLTLEVAQSMLDEGLIDLAAFGRPFISNPDLVDRFRSGYALTPFDRSTFYGGGDRGYIDYPVAQPA
ncbi:alkene reductase [Pseudomonas putida]|nr:alkene reductase [Pseudomonas putida]HDS0962789.1 alkene reductase [Pseudomonas putida]HDS0990023.1 alkene reductase [Pseudomonas putida]